MKTVIFIPFHVELLRQGVPIPLESNNFLFYGLIKAFLSEERASQPAPEMYFSMDHVITYLGEDEAGEDEEHTIIIEPGDILRYWSQIIPV